MARSESSSQDVHWPSQLITGLKWILVSAGLSGLLLALGFVVEIAYQHRLGFQLREPDSVAGLALEGARFLLASLESVFTSCLDHPVYLTIGLALALAVGFLIARSNVRLEARRWLLLLLLLQGVGLLVLDLPAVRVNGLLIHGLKLQDRSAVFQAAWLDQICGRVDDNDYPKLEDLFGIDCHFSSRRHARRVRDLFSLNVVITLLLTGFVARSVLLLQLPGPAASRKPGAYLILGPLLLLAILDLALLPYSYGKLARTTDASEVLVYHNLEGVEEQPVHGWILFERQLELALFHKDEQQIWLIPRQAVRLVKIEGERDVVQYLLRKQLESGRSIPPPP